MREDAEQLAKLAEAPTTAHEDRRSLASSSSKLLVEGSRESSSLRFCSTGTEKCIRLHTDCNSVDAWTSSPRRPALELAFMRPDALAARK
jgi:hypothetical protein